MRCSDCGGRFDLFDQFVPVYQRKLEDEGAVVSTQVSGWVHLWHLTNPEPTP